jgi:hypothetical protein
MYEQSNRGDGGARVDVTADRPGRWIGVRIELGERQGDRHRWAVELAIEHDGPVELAIEHDGPPIAPDSWTWLTPGEARQVAAALVEAADTADRLRARDPRAGGADDA